MPLHYEGMLAIRAGRRQVWGFLVDPHRVSRCLPDVQSLDVLGEGRFRAVVRVGVAFIRGNFTFEVTMRDLQEPAHAVIAGRGSGLGSGVDVTSTVDLADGEGGVTELRWTADVVVSGPLATVGARLLDSTVERKTAELFECVKAQLEA
ncbi:MAG: carbon monoxide dehydrogenase subunit G [Armatimonadota bacterium]|nr:carbon monoxide dehydrogenase subunit G [Armatimonadota bacterium]MDR7452316.1 carbon monoxide dehydrogenase subunit G [Armatimonadota bacterium]MDR7467793.1 carbon monoxide dehydrogenase subunit G [Armatimonadota bacterium]MDR7494621.1 carbon monoxide dehydrogenase subunit G [Armatimonadota bacterium]MDR7499681.1 carbon monoxide dehydrogenase subunit G [Armatimonadota bacterium]